MLNAKLVLLLAGTVAVGATLLVDGDSTIASIANSDGTQVSTEGQEAAAQPAQDRAGASSGSSATQSLNFEQPTESSAMRSDFYGDDVSDGGFASDAQDEDDPNYAPITSEPSSAPSMAQQQPVRPSAARAGSPAAMPSNGKPAQPMALGPPPSSVSGL